MPILWLMASDGPTEYDIQIRSGSWWRPWRTVHVAQVASVIAIHWSRVRIGPHEIARLRMNGRTIGKLTPVKWSATRGR